MALAAQTKEILQNIKVFQENTVVHQERLLTMYEGQLLEFVEESLRDELEPSAYLRARKRIAPINILTKLVNKISKVYNNGVVRSPKVDNALDQTLIEEYEDSMDINNLMSYANRLLNLHKYCALEPYVDQGTIKMRVLAGNQFTVWSDDPVNPDKPTHCAKFMGRITKKLEYVDDKGRRESEPEDVLKEVALFYVYTAQEFIIIDSDGEVRYELMAAMGLEDGINPLGTLPIVYIKSRSSKLIPYPDTDTIQMTTLIPKLLTDLNYATMFQSHSIVYGIDVDPTGLSGNPDSFWVINSKDGEGKSPQIGTIKPTVDIDKVLTLIKNSMAMWLDSKAIKPGSLGSLDAETAASGVSKMIDEADTTEVRKEQAEILRAAERELWPLIKFFNNEVEGVEEQRRFSDDFAISIEFGEQKPLETIQDKLNIIKMKLDLGLISKKQALRIIYPDFTEEEIQATLEEAQEEKRSNLLTFGGFDGAATNVDDTDTE